MAKEKVLFGCFVLTDNFPLSDNIVEAHLYEDKEICKDKFVEIRNAFNGNAVMFPIRYKILDKDIIRIYPNK